MRKLLAIVALMISCVWPALGELPTVVATHAVFAEFAEIIGGQRIRVVSIIPSGFCPGHYDLRPSDVAEVARASLVVYSGIETWMDTLVRAAGDTTQVVQLSGPWNTPPAAMNRVEELEALLSARFPEHSEEFGRNATSYNERLLALGEDLLARASELEVHEVPAVAIAWQKDFLSWLGIPVVSTYPPPESLSIRNLVELAREGAEAGAQLVVDNLQSGVEFGGKLAAQMGAEHVVLSNFPGAMPNTATVIDLLTRNAEALFWALTPLE